MKYKLENGKEITIPDKEIDKLVNGLDLSIEEAIQTYLEDNEYEINEQVEEMTQKAKTNRITASIHKARKETTVKREVKRKEDPDKEMIIKKLSEFLKGFVETVEVTNIGKIIEFDLNGEHYKLDLIKQRKKKNETDK